MKSERFRKNSTMILWFLRGSIRYFAAGGFFACAAALLDLINPRVIGFTVDAVLGDTSAAVPSAVLRVLETFGGLKGLRAHLWWIALFVAGTALLSVCCGYGYRLLTARGAERFVRRMRDRLFEHIAGLPFSWFGENHTGDIIQRCTADVETVKTFVSEQLTHLFRILVLIVFALYFMFGIQVKLAALSAAFIPVIVLYSAFFHGRIFGTFEEADIEEGKLSTITQENLTGVRVVRAFGREKFEKERFGKQNSVYTDAYLRLCRVLSAFWSFGDLFSGLQTMSVVIYGAVLCTQGQLTAGAYIAFITYNEMLIWPVRMLGRVISEMSKAGVSVERIRYIMNSPEEMDREGALSGEADAPVDRDISFEHVTWSYGPGLPRVLDDVSFTVPAGQTFGILGATGSGKSTLMLLLDRMYELPEENGKITIGGVDIADMKRSWLRRNVGMVLQDPFLFSRTIAVNIGITSEEPSMDAIRSAARTAALDETVMRFHDGYETEVGERGMTLSGGQKQRASIAQMLFRRTKIRVFDDALSAVDARTDAQIRASVAGERDGATVILISHRITTLMQADHIIVLEKGRIAEEGTHESLLQRNGIYRKIYELQTQGME